MVARRGSCGQPGHVSIGARGSGRGARGVGMRKAGPQRPVRMHKLVQWCKHILSFRNDSCRSTDARTQARRATRSTAEHGRARQSSTAERWGRQGEVSPEGVARSLREVAGASLHKRSRQAAAHLVPALRSARTQAPRPRTCDDGHTKSSYCITVCINRPVFLFCFLTRGLQFNSVYKDDFGACGERHHGRMVKTKMAVAAGTAALTGVAYCVVFVMPSMAVPV